MKCTFSPFKASVFSKPLPNPVLFWTAVKLIRFAPKGTSFRRVSYTNSYSATGHELQNRVHANGRIGINRNAGLFLCLEAFCFDSQVVIAHGQRLE